MTPETQTETQAETGADQSAAPDDAALKQDFLAAVLSHIPFDGFGETAMTRAGDTRTHFKEGIARGLDGGVSYLDN
jgi:hypothetical protein